MAQKASLFRMPGMCIQYYVHVACRAHLHALEYRAAGEDSVVLHLGNGEGSSVRRVPDAVKKLTGQRLEVCEASRHPGDPARLIAISRGTQYTAR